MDQLYPPSPNLEVNFVLRVVLGILAILVCIVPGKLLFQHGDLGAVVWVANVTLSNLINVTNALIWHTDDTSTWWPGPGFCDIQTFIVFPMQTQYACCILVIMRNLAHNVGLSRVTSLTKAEKRRRYLVDALIIFGPALVEVGATYPLNAYRYQIKTLEGCSAWYAYDWVFLVFFVLPVAIVTLLCIVYAGKKSPGRALAEP
jgi:pheromone a factor receptor